MMSDEEIEQLADGWIKEFSADPYELKQREMEHWFALNDLIHNRPEEALRVFECVAQKEMSDWTFEGLGIGPLRTFLMLYPERYNIELQALARRQPQFAEMYQMAVEGL